MKRTTLLLCTAILLVCSLYGCAALPGENTSYPDRSKSSDNSAIGESDDANAEDAALTVLQKEISQNGSVVGVAFIGYVDSDSSEVNLHTCLASSETGKEYPALSHAMLFMADGQELYAIVPASEKGTITVYPSAMTGNGEYADDKRTPLHTGKPGLPLLLRCNFSEIYSNVLVTATDGGGAVDFRPSLSMENGRLQESAGVYDFSVYEDAPDENSLQIATEVLLEAEEVKYAVEHGMKIMYTGDTQMIEGRVCLLFVLGTDREEQFVRERYYGVCDNLIYAYDVVNDTWVILGAE